MSAEQISQVRAKLESQMHPNLRLPSVQGSADRVWFSRLCEPPLSPCCQEMGPGWTGKPWMGEVHIYEKLCRSRKVARNAQALEIATYRTF